MVEKFTLHLSNFVELIVTREGKYGWRLKKGEFKGIRRPDQTVYANRNAALAAAAKGLERACISSHAEAVSVEVVIDSPAEMDLGHSALTPAVRGEKRRRAGGHGYAGGDGFTRLK